ncbi:MAG: YraN family protein [Coriobacteriia bacterium]|nr:YraN family protein [Coriobacteriia bacterium]
MSDRITSGAGSGAGKPQEELREPFAFENGAESYSDQMRRMREAEEDAVRQEEPAPSDDDPEAGQACDPELPPEDREGGCHNRDLGKRGEDAAARYLERRGYNILARNWTCKHGEADIVAQDENALVFVEVKTRSNVDFGMPEEAVTPAKRNKYERIAAAFLREYPCSETVVRFDVVGLLVVGNNRALIKHHINAFGVA